MKRLSYLPLLLGFVGLFLAGCDSFGPGADDTSGRVILNGQILNEENNNPIAGAFVRVLPYDLLFETNEEGRYTAEVVIDSTMDLQVVATKDGFSDRRVTVLALADRTIEVPTLHLNQFVNAQPVSGKASNILLTSQSAESIGVKESGSKEVATINFQVADSLGRPVVLENGTEVHFSFGVQPGGGEFLSPTIARTDGLGKVSVNLSSGTRAGVVQIAAETTVGGNTIRSLPVSVAIHGGLPDQAHFTLGPTLFNFPGLVRFGLTNGIRVLAGDEHSNPVKPGTSIYFDTNYGIIEGSTQTGGEGQGGVNLISGNPFPPDGVATVTARTADKNQNVVSDTTPVLFSGTPIITVTPATAELGQTYNFTVQDFNGNPLAKGTSIVVEAQGTKVKAVGNNAVTLDDTVILGEPGNYTVVKGAGITDFAFRAVQDLSTFEEGTPTLEAIKISISGPNGAVQVILTAITGAAPVVTTEGATLTLDGDTAIIRAPEEW